MDILNLQSTVTKIDGKDQSLLKYIGEEDWNHCHFAAKADPYVVKSEVIDFYYDSEGRQVETKFLPHHIACQHPAVSVSFIKTLYKIHPHGFSVKDSHYQRLPLHLACMVGCSLEVILELMASEDPEDPCDQGSVKTADALGRLPIHYACKHQHLKEALEQMVKMCPESLTVADVNGFLPVHIACRFGQPVALIKFLLFKAPESISAETKKGNTPMLLASNFMEDGERKRQIMGLLARQEYTDSLFRKKGLRA